MTTIFELIQQIDNPALLMVLKGRVAQILEDMEYSAEETRIDNAEDLITDLYERLEKVETAMKVNLELKKENERRSITKSDKETAKRN